MDRHSPNVVTKTSLKPRANDCESISGQRLTNKWKGMLGMLEGISIMPNILLCTVSRLADSIKLDLRPLNGVLEIWNIFLALWERGCRLLRVGSRR